MPCRSRCRAHPLRRAGLRRAKRQPAFRVSSGHAPLHARGTDHRAKVTRGVAGRSRDVDRLQQVRDPPIKLAKPGVAVTTRVTSLPVHFGQQLLKAGLSVKQCVHMAISVPLACDGRNASVTRSGGSLTTCRAPRRAYRDLPRHAPNGRPSRADLCSTPSHLTNPKP